MAKPFGFLESSYTVVFPMFNQCIRFGEGGGAPNSLNSSNSKNQEPKLSLTSMKWD